MAEPKTLAWAVGDDEWRITSTCVLHEMLRGVKIDMYPCATTEAFFGVNTTSIGRDSLYILKTMITTFTEEILFNPTPLENGNKGHPFFALEKKIRGMGFNEESLESWLTALKRIRVVGSSFEWEALMSDKLGPTFERRRLEQALVQMN